MKTFYNFDESMTQAVIDFLTIREQSADNCRKEEYHAEKNQLMNGTGKVKIFDGHWKRTYTDILNLYSDFSEYSKPIKSTIERRTVNNKLAEIEPSIRNLRKKILHTRIY